MTVEDFVAIGASVVVLLATAAFYVVPEATFLHAANFAAVIGFALFIAARASVGRSGLLKSSVPDRPLAVGFGGAALAAVAVLTASLLAADTTRISGVPGTSVDTPIGKAQFPNAASDPITLDSGVALSRPRIIGNHFVTTQSHIVAELQVRDRAGQRLTITQPGNAAFLSPLLAFAGTTTILGSALPSDSFAIPAKNRSLAAFYVDQKTAATDRFMHATGSRPGVLFAEQNAGGKTLNGGIGFVADTQTSPIGDLAVHVDLERYPALIIASAPEPIPSILGIGAMIGGLTIAVLKRR